MPPTAPGRTTRAVLRLAVLLLLASVVSCSEGARPRSGARQVEPGGTETVSLSAHAVTTRSQVAHVYGRLPRTRRSAVRRQVAHVVDRWWEAAFLGGDFPRTTFPSAFPGFTRGAEARARRDKRLMSNLGLGEHIEAVTPRHRQISLDVLAVRGRARSVTARFVLRFRTAGEKERLVSVRGRLFLTRHTSPSRPGGGWRIFGYDVAKGSSA